MHAARTKAIRELTPDDIDRPSRCLTIAGHRQALCELTHNALVAWLDYRRNAWPDTADRHVLISLMTLTPGRLPGRRHLDILISL